MILDRVLDSFAKRVAAKVDLRSAAVRTPIEASAIAGALAGVNPSPGGIDPAGWMTPNVPTLPQHQGAAGRRFDYPVGWNLQYTPRATEAVSFQQLRTLAVNYDLLAIVIETRLDQLVKFEYKIGPRDEKKKEDDRCTEIEEFLTFPDGQHSWAVWLRAFAAEALITDAATLYPQMNRGGKLHALRWFDGTTLKPVIDDNGCRPDPPDVAYQQILKGIPAVDYSADEIIYVPRNMRVNKLYGFPPVEQVIMTVNIALRRQLSQLAAYTSGNIPEALIGVPKEWSPKQIAEFQGYWDDLIEGDLAEQRKAKFVPGGMSITQMKEALLKDPFDEWLARVVCFAFSIPPSPFVKDMNRATSESAKEAATEEGLFPLMKWVKDVIDLVIWKYFGYRDLEFQWQEEDATDPLEAAQIEDIRIKNGTLAVDEVRQDLGKEGIGMGNAVYTSTGPVLVKDIINPEQNVLSPAHPDNPGNPKNVNARAEQQAADAKTQSEAQIKADAEAKAEKDVASTKDAEKFEKSLVASKPEINITMPEIVYNAPPVTVNQAPIHLRMPDVLVETGMVKVDNHVEQAPPASLRKSADPAITRTLDVVTKRVGDHFEGTITRKESRTVVLEKNAEGKPVMTVNGEPVDA